MEGNVLCDVPWNKSGLSSSYSGGSSSYAGSKTSDSGLSTSTSQYDGGGSGGYGRRLSSGGLSSGVGSSSYLSSSGSSYRSPFLGSSYSRGSSSSYLSNSKDSGKDSSSTGKVAERRDSKDNERMSLRDKYTTGTYPGRTRDSSLQSSYRDKDDTESSHRSLGRSISVKSNRESSPEPTSTSAGAADASAKSDRIGYSSSLSPYRLYSRSSYSRSTSRDSAPDTASSTTSTPATTPVHTPTSLRFGSSSRYGSNIIRSPVSEKPPSIFGLSSLGYSGRSLSRSNSQQDSEESKPNEGTTSSVEVNSENAQPETKDGEVQRKYEQVNEEEVTQTTFITVVTRGTSPTPPSTTSSYIRTRRTDLARVIEKTIAKPKARPEMVDKEIQSDRGDDTARLSRYGVSSRWSTYLDRYPSAASSYSPVSRYSSRYTYSTRGDKEASKSDEKESKPSLSQESSDNVSANATSENSSSKVVLSKDVTKDAVLPGQKFQSSLVGSSERKADNDVNGTKKSEPLKTDVEKLKEKSPSSSKIIESKEVRSNASSDPKKESIASKTKLLSKEETKSTDSQQKKDEISGAESIGLTRVASGKDVNSKAAPMQSNSTVSTRSVTGSSSIETPQSKYSVDGKTEGFGLTRVKSIKNMNAKPPVSTDVDQTIENKALLKSRNSSSASLSSETTSEKQSSIDGSKSATNGLSEGPLSRVKSVKNFSEKITSQSGTDTPIGIKSKSSSSASLSSDERTPSIDESVSKDVCAVRNEAAALTRTKSFKSMSTKPPVPTGAVQTAETTAGLKTKSASSASLSSEGAIDKKSSKQEILSKASSEEGSLTNTPSSEASLSKTPSNEGPLSKTSPQTKTPSDFLSSKLPPPVPKTETNTPGLKTSSSLHSLNKLGVANKDFRKSPLNVELSNALQADEFKKNQEKQRQVRKSERKFKRSNSTSSGDSENYYEDGSTQSLPPVVSNDTSSLRTTKSLTKLHPSSSTSKLPSSTTTDSDIRLKHKSPDRTKSRIDINNANKEMSSSSSRVEKAESSDSDSDSSSTETTSSSESSSSSSDDENKGLTMKRLGSSSIRRRSRKSPTTIDTQNASLTEAHKASSTDELSVSIDKPPKSPSSPKPAKTEESKSFLMRALAPVTNLFRGKQESSSSENISEGLQRTGSNQSLNKSDKENAKDDAKKPDTTGKIVSQDSGSDSLSDVKEKSRIKKEDKNDIKKIGLKYNIRKQESGERAWWLESNPNIPEGIKRIESNTSINKLEADSSKLNSVQNVSSASSVNNEQDSQTEDDDKEKVKKKIHKISHNKSAELPIEVIEGIKKIHNSSVNKLHCKDEDGKTDVVKNETEGKSEGVQRTNSSSSLLKTKDSDADAAKPPIGGDKVKRKIHRIRHQQSGELPWWLDNSASIPDGIKRIESNTSINKLAGDTGNKAEESSKEDSTEKTNSVKKTSSNVSLNKDKDSDPDAGKPPIGGEKIKRKIHRIRHQQSGELPWWLDSNSSVPEGIKKVESNSSINKLLNADNEEIKDSKVKGTDKELSIQKTPSSTSLNKGKQSDHDIGKTPMEDSTRKKFNKLRHQQSGELPWWLDNNAPIPEGVQRIHSNSSINKLVDSDGESKKADGVQRIKSNASINKLQDSDSDSKKPEGVKKVKSNSSVNKLQSSDSDGKKSGEEKTKRKIYKIRHHESGELPWWLDNNGAQPEGVQRIKSNHSVNKLQEEEKKLEENNTRIFPYKIRRQESGEKAWWLSSRGDIPEGVKQLSSSSESSEDEVVENNKEQKDNTSGSKVPKFPLNLPTGSSTGKESQPTEETGRHSPYDNLQEPESRPTKGQSNKSRPKNLPLFIGSHTNIDDILGTAATLVNPVMGLSRLRKKHEGRGAGSSNEEDSGGELSECEEVDPGQVRIHDSTAKTPQIQRLGDAADGTRRRRSSGMIKLDDTALQLYKDGDYGSYLDLEASINEQQEEFDGFQTNRKNSIVLRTQLSVRVHTIIEKLLNSEGRELRRALFSLKQIFQEDKDLVHEFVQNDGLACLIKVGSEADQNYQNYILRALGQVMLYVDGMNGVMEHNETVQWLYALIASKFRLVVKTALKLLLVFVEYVETNCLLLIKAVHAVDTAHGLLPWSNIVKLLKDYDAADTELLIYAMTLVNKTLNGTPDQDTYYDQVDALEEQGIEGTIQRYMSKQGTDLDLLRQFQIYEAVLHHEDGEEKGTPLKQLDETVRKTLRNRKSLTESMTAERRKSRRHSTGTSPMSSSLGGSMRINNSSLQSSTVADDEESESSSSRSSPGPELNGSYKECKAGDAGVTPALRRRRERAERQRSFIREQQETAATLKATLGSPDDGVTDENTRLCQRIGNGTLDNGETRSSNKLQQMNRTSSRKDLTPLMNAVNKMQDTAPGSEAPEGNGILKKPWVLSMMYGKNSAEEEGEETLQGGENEQDDSAATSERKKILQLKRENTVKDLTQKLANQNIIHSPVEEGNNKSINRIGDMTGLISKAKEGLAKSKSKQDVVKSPTSESILKVPEVKKSETELHWEELVHSMKRPLSLCDLDFTDLRSDDEVDILSPAHISNGGPPPPPPVPMAPGMPSSRGGMAPPPPPPVSRFGSVAPPPMPPSIVNPPLFGVNLRSQRSSLGSSSLPDTAKTSPSSPVKKTKKTVKLFWKEVRDDPIILAKLQQAGMIWDELNPVNVDTQKLEHLFESRAKDLITKKQQEMNKNKEIIVLDHKRSNAINIGMTKLPPPRSIKTAILKMDATIMNREGIEKLLTMLPTEEERSKIQEAQVANPDMPLGSAEQFLLTLASISELPARLKLWAFKLDFENSEKEIAEPLMDLKQGMETLKANKTFRGILSTLLSIGIFLNGNEVKGFQIEYLAKVPEVKDTVHKHSLLHHLCHMVMEKFPDSSDLYSEIGAVTRASKVDFDELAANILKMEQECKASWDHLKVIAKHDGSTMKVKMSDFLADCAERIIVLGIVHRRVMNRFHKFLLWLGIPLHRVADTKPNEFCRIVSEFSLEYRTTRERVLQQLEKKANHRERNKTRGKMITEVGKFRTKEDRADAELRQLLGSDLSDAESIHGTLPWRRQRKDIGRTVLSPLAREETVNGNLTDGDDEILESLVKTATKAPTTRTTPRERKRTRHADRKSLKRSRTRENNPVEGGRESP
ncbi:platelet binding protein GspB isoform X3 [Periplaneta americana]|uniref:platelet binding protein GspB isoform X3 n=1 Tax=Periplaneta americana TaxID=6978 RepID=UPI0037E88905